MPPQRTTLKTKKLASPRPTRVTRNSTAKPAQVDLPSNPAPIPSISTLQDQIETLQQAKREQHQKLTAEIKRLKQQLKEKEREQKKKAVPPPRHESLTHWKELYQVSETKHTALKGQYEEAKKTVTNLERRVKEQRKQLEDGDTATHLEIIRVLEGDLVAEREHAQRHDSASKMHKAAHDKLKAHAEDIWRNLECPMCFETTWEPMVLNCGHVFCAACTRLLTSCGSCRAPIHYPAVQCYPLKQMTRSIRRIAAPHEHSPRK